MPVSFCCIMLAGIQTGCFSRRMMERSFNRDAQENTGPVPDYAQLSYWAASPYKYDCSDSLPSFLQGERRDTSADVFFIHPTSYTSDLMTASWNADLSDTSVNHQTDVRSILYQASVFNGSCRVFAPRYRQAHLKAFIAKESDLSKDALDLAYSDIKRAFQYYLKHDNNGRPIIIASHSQGSHHAVRLLQEFFDGTPLQQQLVCAYIIGWAFDAGNFHHIPIGDSAAALHCVVGWCTFQNGEEPHYFKIDSGHAMCVNPLTWTTSTQWAPEAMHQGSIFRDLNTLYPHIISAGIDPKDHVLWVKLPDTLKAKLKNTKNLHVVDYNLFWMDIRKNVEVRVQAFFKAATTK
jgi:hypothetical protein